MADPGFIDTHCHLDFEVFSDTRDEILQRCRNAGVKKLVVPGVTEAGWDRLVSLCRRHDQLWPALGLHPCFIAEHRVADLERLEQRLKQGEAVAVGEIGLDFWPGSILHDRQLEYFTAQLELARRYDLPILLHVRKAHDQVLKLLRRQRPKKGGIVHAFSGSLQQADQYLQLGFRIGVGGALTWERARRLRATLAALPIEALVLETDAPDMPLSGHQGEPNRPDYLVEVFRGLAELRSESPDRLMAQLWQNSIEVLGI